MTPTQRRIIIAGAGIGGLTAALTLARAGFRVDVFERAARVSEFGAGLQISPNASRLLIGLGLEHRLEHLIGRPLSLVVRSGPSAEVLVDMPLGEAAVRRWGAPTWVVHRGDLQAALAGAAAEDPDIAIHTGHTIEGAVEHQRGLSVLVAGPKGVEELEAAALIAADGVRSKLRALVTGPSALRFTGKAAWRAVVPVEAVPQPLAGQRTGLWLGPAAHLVHYPLRNGTVVNIVAITRLDQGFEDWAAPGRAEEVQAAFAGFAPLARSLIACPTSWTRWALFDRNPSARYAAGRIALLGDAAHPMLPFLAQGASMAIEDAHVLARTLSETPNDVPAALERYSKARAPRAGRVQREARFNDTVFHFGFPAAIARDMGLRVMGGDGMMQRYDWLYGWKG